MGLKCPLLPCFHWLGANVHRLTVSRWQRAEGTSLTGGLWDRRGSVKGILLHWRGHFLSGLRRISCLFTGVLDGCCVERGTKWTWQHFWMLPTTVAASKEWKCLLGGGLRKYSSFSFGHVSVSVSEAEKKYFYCLKKQVFCGWPAL